MTVAAAMEIYQVTILGKIENQDCLNIMYFRTELGSNNVELQLLKAIVDCFVNNLIPVLSPQFVFAGVKGKRVTPDVGPDLFVAPATNQENQGQSVGDGQASFVTARCRIRSRRGGKSGLGRFSIGGIPESATLNSSLVPESAFWLAFVAYVACVVAAFIQEGFASNNQWSLGVMSRKIGGVKPPFLPAGFSLAASLQPQLLLGTMNSRKIGHGS